MTLVNPRVNNLKVKTLQVPVGVLTVVTGVSGSGKSSLIMDALVPALSHALQLSEGAGPAESVQLPKGFKKLVVVDQSPIGTTPRSTPATTTKLMDSLRDLYAQAPIAKERGWDKGRFSFNNAEGRCAHCEGRGSILVEMHFLSDVWVVCEHCKGRRFNDATLEARWAGLSIADALDLRVDEALEVFGKHKALAGPLRQLQDVGLGYIRLGQPATTMSGGEAQRVKLAKELGSRGVVGDLRLGRAHDGPTLRRRRQAHRRAAAPRRQRRHGHRHRAQPRRHPQRRPRHRHGPRGRRRRG
jgi:excinuclease ABC subunit A